MKTPEEIVEELTQYFTGNGDYCFTYITPEDCLRELKKQEALPKESDCDEWIHQERIKQNDDKYCPLCGDKLQ